MAACYQIFMFLLESLLLSPQFLLKYQRDIAAQSGERGYVVSRASEKRKLLHRIISRYAFDGLGAICRNLTRGKKCYVFAT